MSDAFSPAGRDGRVPSWLAGGERPEERPRHDSIVVRGNGIGALACAARLARSESLRGRVVIAAPRPMPSRQLRNGCTLRARTLDYLAASLGMAPDTLATDLFGERVRAAETRTQQFSLFGAGDGRQIQLGKLSAWMGADGGSVLAYGLRNSHLVDYLAVAVEGMGVRFAGEIPQDLAGCRKLAIGSDPFVVNGSHLGVSDLPGAPAPDRFVVASQVPLCRRPRAVLPLGSSMITMRRRDGRFDAGVFYPFADPLSPEADLYGIVFRIVRKGVGLDKQAEMSAMRAAVDGISDALGFDLVDPEATRGEAMVPCLPWADVPEVRPDWLDLHRTYSACTPIITGDGMTRAALAGWVAAEAVLAGEKPHPIVNRCLGRWRSANRGMAGLMTYLPRFSEPLLRRRPRWLLAPAANAPDMWASIA